MILSAQSIRKAGIITPFHEKTIFDGMSYGLGAAGYDIRVREDVILFAHACKLASSLEHFKIPNNVLAKVADKSSWARKFVTVQNTIIESGWRGYLTLEIINHNPHQMIKIKAGSPIAQIIFHLLDEPTELPYQGKYQDQAAEAVAAIYERGTS